MKFSNLNRVYTKLPLTEDISLRLGFEHLHYLQVVLRMKPGRQIRVFNETDGEFLAVINTFEKQDILINILKSVRKPTIDVPLTLALCTIKQDKWFNAINMAVQIGVTGIVPIIAERSQMQTINLGKLSKIIIEAAEQSERLSIPKFTSPLRLAEFISSINCEMIIYANENELVRNWINKIQSPPENLAYLVGPEGGFAPSELEILESSPKTFSVSLGSNILRTEAAVIAGLAQIQLMREINADS